jgi:hypothetical protein
MPIPGSGHGRGDSCICNTPGEEDGLLVLPLQEPPPLLSVQLCTRLWSRFALGIVRKSPFQSFRRRMTESSTVTDRAMCHSSIQRLHRLAEALRLCITGPRLSVALSVAVLFAAAPLSIQIIVVASTQAATTARATVALPPEEDGAQYEPGNPLMVLTSEAARFSQIAAASDERLISRASRQFASPSPCYSIEQKYANYGGEVGLLGAPAGPRIPVCDGNGGAHREIPAHGLRHDQYCRSGKAASGRFDTDLFKSACRRHSGHFIDLLESANLRPRDTGRCPAILAAHLAAPLVSSAIPSATNFPLRIIAGE